VTEAAWQALSRTPIRACLSAPLGLETRGLHALAREKTIDSLAMNTQHTADTHGVETAVVDEAPDRLGMHAELVRDLANADETGISACRRHAARKPSAGRPAPPARALGPKPTRRVAQ
jgi:hypothetical protein